MIEIKTKDIKFTIDHDTVTANSCMLIGDFNEQRFVKIFNQNSIFDISLRFAKYQIMRKFKIIYG